VNIAIFLSNFFKNSIAFLEEAGLEFPASFLRDS
jgi:hypothetical protein